MSLLDFRILPVAIGAAAVGLVLRVADLVEHGSPQIAHAQQAPQPAPSRPAAATPATPAAQPAAQPRAPAAQPAQRAPEPARAAPLDPDTLTQAEIEVLQDLSQRRMALERLGQELAQREALLQAAEQRIEARLQELRQIQTSIEGTVRRNDEQEQQRLRSLVRMFEAMRPLEAARIFEQMEMPILVEIIERMREAKAAPILAQLNPIRARQITGEMARRRVPAPGESAGQPARTPG